MDRERVIGSRLAAALVSLAALVVPASAVAAPGDLVAGFGTNAGRTIVDFGGDEQANAVVVQRDGRIIVAGTTSSGAHPENFAIARLATNGAIDGGFGTNGRTILDFGLRDFGNAAALAPDGKVLLAGASGTPPDFAMARLLAGGGPDIGFGSVLPARRLESFGARTARPRSPSRPTAGSSWPASRASAPNRR